MIGELTTLHVNSTGSRIYKCIRDLEARFEKVLAVVSRTVPYAKKIKIYLLSMSRLDASKWSLGVLYVESNWTEFLYF